MATMVRTDEQIQRDVQAELKWDSRVRPSEIGVIVKDGVVALTGWVDSYTKRWAAEDAAKRVSGAKAIANEIEVRLPSSAERTDADIAAAARRALEWDAVLPVDRFKVVVSKGIVTLEGTVDWYFEKEDAERVIRRLTGIRGVINLLTVSAKQMPAPEELKKNIEDALVRSAELDANRIKVETKDGKAILKGTVRSWAEREEAERVAWRAQGITSVVNQIVINPSL